MPSILNTLEQEEMWYGQDGFPYRIDEMETSHIYNVLAFLRRRAKNLYDRHTWAEIMSDDFEDCPMSEIAVPQVPDKPEEWLERKPLIRKFERLLKLRDSIEPDTLSIEGQR
jgi:hypothetical protein